MHYTDCGSVLADGCMSPAFLRGGSIVRFDLLPLVGVGVKTARGALVDEVIFLAALRRFQTSPVKTLRFVALITFYPFSYWQCKAPDAGRYGLSYPR